jgi:hypothetical protein
MPQTPPWHAGEDDVHHDNTECVRAARVPASKRLDGEGGKPICSICARLNSAEESLPTQAP